MLFKNMPEQLRQSSEATGLMLRPDDESDFGVGKNHTLMLQDDPHGSSCH